MSDVKVQSHDIGADISADRVGETFYPRYRIVIGAVGSPTDVSNATPLPAKIVGGGSIVTASYDYITVAYPDDTTETYTYKTGGSGGATVATVVVVYTDSTKANLSTVTRS